MEHLLKFDTKDKNLRDIVISYTDTLTAWRDWNTQPIKGYHTNCKECKKTSYNQLPITDCNWCWSVKLELASITL